MRRVTEGREPRFAWASELRPALAILCIALVLFTCMLQVTHSHPDGRIDPDCSLCMTAHTVAQVVVVVAVQITSQPVERYITDTYCAPVSPKRFTLKLASRPPPVPSAFA